MLQKRNFNFQLGSNIFTDMFYVETGKNNFCTVKINIDGNSKYVNSKYDPVKEALSEINDINIEPGGALFCFGLSLGYHIRELLKILPSNGKLYVIEPSEAFLNFVLINIDLTDILADSRVEIILQGSEVDIKDIFVKKVSMEQVLYSKIFCWPVYKELYPEKCKSFINAFQYLRTFHITDATTTVVMTSELHKNYIKNIKYVINNYGVGDFIESYKNKPAIVIAAGPSLSKNISVLSEAKGKFLLVSAYSAKGALTKNNIKADIVTTLDPFQTEPERQNGVSIRQDEPLLALTSSDRYLLEAASDKIIFNQNLEIEYLPKSHFISKGSSVAIFSLSFAIAIGANPIIFVGQDLAFTDDKGHADGTMHVYFENDMENGAKQFPVDDVYGNKVMTCSSYTVYKTQIEFMINEHKDRTFIDATEGGAYIEGTKVMTLRDVINKYTIPGFDVNEYLEKVYKASKLFKTLEDRNDFYRQLKKALFFMKELKKDSEEMMEYSSKALKSVKYNSSNKKSDIIRYDKKVRIYKEKIISMKFETSFMNFMVNFFTRRLLSLYNKNDEEFLKYVNFYAQFAETYYIAARDTIPLFEETLEQIGEMLKNQEETRVNE